jgi:pseudouridine-5'-phosphate glycosidase
VTELPVVLSDRVAEALAAHRPVVALESTIISHGFPRPRNAEVARLFEQTLLDAGVTPATIAVIDGVPTIGLDDAALHRIAEDDSVVKVSTRDLGPAMATGRTGGATVAATALLASLAGIRVFATGGLGGVHRPSAGGHTYDESADLIGLSRTNITVVSAGVKSILDIGATLERLETYDVTVLGYQTDRFPSFWLRDSGFDLDWRVDSADEITRIMAAGDRLGRVGAIVVANPLPVDKQLDPALHDRTLADSLVAAEKAGVHGKEVTPFLLNYFQQATGGASLEVNIDIARNNIRLGAEIARSWAS